MKENEVIANNKLIADFMGWLHSDNEDLDMYEMNSLKYHTSWDWLMPVVEKIEAIHSKHHGYFGVHISSNNCTIQGTKFRSYNIDINNPVMFMDVYGDTKIDAAYKCIVQFITWYNNKPPNF